MAKEALVVVPENGYKATEHATTNTADGYATASLYVGAAEKLFELNRTAVLTSIDEQCAVAIKAADERSLLAAWRLQASYVFAGTAKAVAYWRHASEILLDTYADAVSDAENRLNRGFLAMTGALEDMTVGVGSTILTGDPDLATERMKETADIIAPPGNGKFSGAAR
ncbi:phasin family protein [Paraburkholderia sp. UYCP14C]|uniref:TIGR01841 family phasin n=1 Tax=Paraburkholderia sp. UYCP14C TaxID=2511130 RepID=UPI0010224333|nr:TIGR01841 family phasin [Paraburkholderia sp. UYCP14C]RZF26489.1 phasin family protein [Paraburkholderia sp. UYCP14C]